MKSLVTSQKFMFIINALHGLSQFIQAGCAGLGRNLADIWPLTLSIYRTLLRESIIYMAVNNGAAGLLSQPACPAEG